MNISKLQFVFLLSLTSILLYQLIGITINFFAFNTITKLDVKSNEKDFNYPFITLSFKDQSYENIGSDLGFDFVEELNLGIVLDYDKNCNFTYLQNNKGVVNWKIHFMLNCRQNNFHNQIVWNNFPNKLDELKLKADQNYSFKNYGWYLSYSNANHFYLMNSFLTLGFNFENRFKTFQKFHHLNTLDNNVQLLNILLHSQPILQISEIPTFTFHFKENNFTIIVRKVLRSYLEPPFGNCNNYLSPSHRAFNASSHMQCYRRCLIYFARYLLKCEPVFHRLLYQ